MNGITCNCGVIVREMNSVLKVSYDQCGQWFSATNRPLSVTRLLTQYPDDGTEITRDETGKKFSVSCLHLLRCGNQMLEIKIFF